MNVRRSPLPDRLGARPVAAFAGGVGLCVVAVVLGCASGAVSISPLELLSIPLEALGVSGPASPTPQQSAVFMAIRLPRVLLGLAVGAGLATAGVMLQGIFRNPLASPSLIGVSNGAALVAAFIIVLGAPPAFEWAGAMVLPVAAFIGAIVVTGLVMRLGMRAGAIDVTTLLLAGIAVNAIAGAGIGLMVFVADDASLRSLTFWTLGSLGGATWPGVLVVGLGVLFSLFVASRISSALDLLLLGEEDASYLGVHVERVKRTAVAVSALVVGACVAFTGVIGFVGLVVPHLARLLLGPGHRTLLPLAALLGGGLLVLADLASRIVVAPAELPLGVLTTLLGAPFFILLLVRRRKWE